MNILKFRIGMLIHRLFKFMLLIKAYVQLIYKFLPSVKELEMSKVYDKLHYITNKFQSNN